MYDMDICVIVGCNKPIHGRQMCSNHYNRWLKRNPDHDGRKVNKKCTHENCNLRHYCIGLCRSHYQKKYRSEDPTSRVIYNKKRRRELRKNLFILLGGIRCVNCGFSDIRALQFDHINGGGTREQQAMGTSDIMYRYHLKHPEEAKKRLQVLCANCNWIKKYEKNEVIGS